jgi:hypothetical protein
MSFLGVAIICSSLLIVLIKWYCVFIVKFKMKQIIDLNKIIKFIESTFLILMNKINFIISVYFL